MKSILFIVFTLIFIDIYSQTDTIRVSNNIAATCKFNFGVKKIVYGNNLNDKYYEGLILGKNVIVRSKSQTSPIITISFYLDNDDVEVKYLMYDANASKAIYDYKTKVIEEEVKKEKEKEIEVTTKKMLENENDSLIYMARIKQLSGMKEMYYDLVTDRNKIEFSVTKIMNDKNYTYLELMINNKSGGAFDIDGISFTYEEGKSKSVKKDTKKREERLFTKYQSNKDLVSAYSKEIFDFVIPLFNVQENGYLVIIVKEKKGTRDYRIEISGKDLLKVDVFE